jgi:hypothetical protein
MRSGLWEIALIIAVAVNTVTVLIAVGHYLECSKSGGVVTARK